MPEPDADDATASSNTAWDRSALPRDIVSAVESPKTVDELAEELRVNDARVAWYLERLQDAGRVAQANGSWTRTSAGGAFLATPAETSADVTVVPGRTVYDFRQAFADSAAGMFGAEFVQSRGEHGGRLSFEQAEEFRDRLVSLVAEYFAPGMGDRSGTKYGFHWILTPTDLHPLGDDDDGPAAVAPPGRPAG